MTNQTGDGFDGVGAADGCGVYGHAARSVLAKYAAFAEGSANCSLLVLSTGPLEADARTAICASAERLGYGKGGCAWAWTGDAATERLAGTDLVTLVEGLDPVGVIATDARALAALAEAYGEEATPNSIARMNGRWMVGLNGFEEMLRDSDAKQLAWRLMKRLQL